MTWTDESWAMFLALLTHGFAAKTEPTTAEQNVYRILLDDVDPEAATRALKELALEGNPYRPKPAEILERVRRDPSKPTFEEAYRLIFGPRGVLAAEAPRGVLYSDQGEKGAARNQARLERATQMHPLVGSFVARQGVDRLAALPLDGPEADDGPDYSRLRRRELEDSWNRHVEAFDGRETAALAAGPSHGDLHQLDPLKALGLEPPKLPALTAGDAGKGTTP